MAPSTKRPPAAAPLLLHSAADRVHPVLRCGGLRPAPEVFGLEPRPEPASEGLPSSEEVPLPAHSVSSVRACSACHVTFDSQSEQRAHFKLDWHRYNLKRRLEAEGGEHEVVTEEQFDQMIVKYIRSMSTTSTQDGDDDDEDDRMSLSASESEEEEEEKEAEVAPEENDDDDAAEEDEDTLWRRQRHPLLFFQNPTGQLYSVHKCVLTQSQSEERDHHLDDQVLIERLPRLTSRLNWAVFMLGGGHFAGAVFRAGDAVVHKTFHNYTVRAKQGGSQSAHDGAGGHAKSAGASLRRYNELALVQHVQDITAAWRPHLDDCHLIFYRAIGNNRNVLFSGKTPPLDKSDPRLRTVPFATRRATFKEVKRVHDVLSGITSHGDLQEYVAKAQESSLRRKKTKGQASPRKGDIRRSKSREEADRPLPEIVQRLAAERAEQQLDGGNDDASLLAIERGESSTAHLAEFDNTPVPRKRKQKRKKNNGNQMDEEPEHEKEDPLAEKKGQLVTACKSGNVGLLRCLDDHADEGRELLNARLGTNQLTPLHLASQSGHAKIVKALLERGADPCLKDRAKKVPYNLCTDKDTRSAFRNFLASIEAEEEREALSKAAQIPPPPTAEQEARQKARKKAQREAKAARDRLQKERQAEERSEEKERERFAGLSDREKRALAAERRLLSAMGPAEEGRVLQRCFLCAADITGKVPFEYGQFQFCTVKCLQAHRKKPKS